MDSGYSLVRVCCTFMAGVSCSTFDIGPWTYNLSLVFVKLYSCQSSIEKHCKSLYVIGTHFEKCIGAEFLLETWGLGLPTIVHPRLLLDCSTNLLIQHR